MVNGERVLDRPGPSGRSVPHRRVTCVRHRPGDLGESNPTIEERLDGDLVRRVKHGRETLAVRQRRASDAERGEPFEVRRLKSQ